MTTLTTCPSTFVGLGELVDRAIEKGIDRYEVKTSIKTALQELYFNKKRIKLKVSDPSYTLRYRYALKFWNEKTEKGEIENKKQAKDLIDDLKGELNSKFCVYPESNEQEEGLDDFFSRETTTKAKRTNKDPGEKRVLYVTSKCDNKFYVKSTNSSEDEKEVNRKDIELCSYCLICPGDEIEIKFGEYEKEKMVCIVK